ncbi:MAG: 4'-phosphopantetheinyl transferase superfamily protein [Alistipes sp.]
MNRALYIEPIMTDEQASAWTTAADRQHAAAFGAARRCEFLTWRALLRRTLGAVEIGYNVAGAPILLDHKELHISVSHGAERVALCLSDRACGVDIERLDRNFDRVAARYLTPAEEALSSDPRAKAVAWCAKEALYKLAGTSGLDMLRDLHLTALGTDWVEGCIKNGETHRLSVRYLDDAVVVWIL